MTELTQALIGAAQAATLAASQAAQATASQSSPAGGGDAGGLKKDLAKLIPRPQVFNPADREQEVLQWRDWFWSLKQYLVVVDGAYQEELEKMEANPTSEYDWDLMSDEDQQRSRFLYSLLGGLIQGRLVGVLKTVDKFNGYEALRQLLGNCQPQARNRTMNLLQGIMAYPQFNMKNSLLPQILKLEEHFTQYERLGDFVEVSGRSDENPLEHHVERRQQLQQDQGVHPSLRHSHDQMERVSRLILFRYEPNPFEC